MLGLLVVDHGSSRADGNRQILDIAAELRRLRPGDLVAHAHMEIAPPSIDEALADLVGQGVTRIHVLPYLLGDGRHAQVDIPRLVREASARHPGVEATVGGALGPDPRLAAILLERAGLGPAGRA